MTPHFFYTSDITNSSSYSGKSFRKKSMLKNFRANVLKYGAPRARGFIVLAVHINNSLHLARKYARIFVRGHYLFREANSFPRATLEENCELRGTDNVQGQISEHIFKAKLRLLCLLSFKYFSQQPGSASPSYVNTSKFVNWLPKLRHSIFISRISNRLRFS